MFCQKCGTQIPDNVTVCASCGTAVPAAGAAPATGPNPASVAADKVKEASRGAVQALKMFASNPVGGMPGAFEGLGARALSVGITFGVVVALCFLLGIYRFLGQFSGGFGETIKGLGFGGFIKALVVTLVPFVTLAGASFLVRQVFRGAGGLGYDSFIAGASLLPFGGVALVAGVLGFGNYDVIMVCGLFAVCLTVLMLFSGLTRISRISERAATIAIPLMLIVSGWLSKVIYKAMFERGFVT